MRKLILVPAAVAALLLAACGTQAQTPQTDDEPKTVTVYKDGDDDGRSSDQIAASQNNSGSQSGGDSQSGSSSQQGGVIVEDNDDRDDIADPDADDNMRSGGQLPGDFPVPVPDTYQVEAVGNAGNETSAVLRVPSGEDAYNYYRQALADEGFWVEDEGSEGNDYFEAELEFSNNELEGNMDFDGDNVEIDIERYR
ncbi:MAG: hypothetical protein ACR2JR_04030 [Rubrobacteraceae bacterium]